ncbi:MAG: hypothetical protein ACR2HD_04540 [Solirubrobacteraceae bacterium]
MTIFRLIPFSLHGVLELAAGFALMTVPFLFGFASAGVVIAVALGALMIGLALTTVSNGRDGLPIAAHASFDRLLVLALLGSAIALGLTADPRAALWLTLAALAELVLTLSTRYSFRA